MNNNLVIDTVGSPARIILFNKNHFFESLMENKNTYSIYLHETLKNLMETNGIEKIESIFVVAGPGSYTGIKIAAAAAQGLGMAWGVQIFYLCSLDFYFYQHVCSHINLNHSICILKTAREKEYFGAIYKHTGHYDMEPNLIFENNFNSIDKVNTILLIINNEQDKQYLINYVDPEKIKVISHNYSSEIIITTIQQKLNLQLLKPIVPFETEPFYLKEVYFR